MRVILSGLIGQSGTGGQAWAYMQYMVGLRELGHEVYYLEDCGDHSQVYIWETESWTWELDYPAAYVERCLRAAGFENCWIYRAGDRAAGMSVAGFRDLCAQCDLFIIRAVTPGLWRDEYNLPKSRIFIDVDPGFTQMSLAKGDDPALHEVLSRCHRVFTVAQRIGAPDCAIPSAGLDWLPTLPPVSVIEWPIAQREQPEYFTSIMRWRGFRDETFAGLEYGQKDKGFLHYLDLPRLTSQQFRIVHVGELPNSLHSHGWNVVTGELIVPTPDAYRNLIQESRAEFGVAKHTYTHTRSGWFSDRSVCFLASGKPVVLEDTGFADWLPLGEGILPFSNLDQAIRAVEDTNARYQTHSRAARRIAEEMFDARKVIGRLLEMAMS